MRRGLVIVGVAMLGCLAFARPAGAHAELLSTEPVAGVADQDPRQIVLRFSEAVEITPASVRVFDSRSERVDGGRSEHPDGDARVVVAKVPTLDRGVYVVTWRVNSADAHPIHGAFTFRVGPATEGADGGAALAQRLLSAEGGSPVVAALYALARLVAYGSLVVLLGGLGLLVLVWPAGAAISRMGRILSAAWLGAVGATLLGLALYGPFSGGLGLASAFSPSVLLGTLGIRFGRLWGLRLLLLLAVAPLVRLLLGAMSSRGESPRTLVVPAGLLGLGVFATTAAVGHASTGALPVISVGSNVVHLAAVSLWLGGLVLLTLVVLPRRRASEMLAVVPRFSRVALWSVIVILATGTFQSWREVRGLEALTGTPYGRLLILKVALYGGMLAVGALSRRWVQERYRAPRVALSPGPGAQAAEPEIVTVGRLRRFVRAEAIIAGVVLAVTSVLVNTPPARTAVARPFSVDLEAKELVITVTVDPAKVGPTAVHLYTLAPTGAVTDVADLNARLRLPAQDIGPLDIPVQRVAPGHYSAYGFELPVKGLWELEVVARLGEIDRVSAKTTVPVR